MSAQEINNLSSVHLTIKFHAKETILATITAIALKLLNLLLKLHPGLVQMIQYLKTKTKTTMTMKILAHRIQLLKWNQL